MYKFTNGIVVYDEKTRDKYIKAGFKLVIENKEKQITIDEVLVEEQNRNEFVTKEHSRISKKTQKN